MGVVVSDPENLGLVQHHLMVSVGVTPPSALASADHSLSPIFHTCPVR